MKYPEDFNKHEKAIDVSDKEINQMIKDCIEMLDVEWDRADAELATGNIIVQALKFKDKYEIRVIKNCHTYDLRRDFK